MGRIHQPPPVHQTFQGDGFVVCSFCPRPYDFDPNAVPAPYNHSNVDSDEVLYYASSEFMSRKGIEYGSITLHPDGIPHGPHPGRAEASIGAKDTKELAVMMDTFRPLHVAKEAMTIEDPSITSGGLTTSTRSSIRRRAESRCGATPLASVWEPAPARKPVFGKMGGIRVGGSPAERHAAGVPGNRPPVVLSPGALFAAGMLCA